VSGRVIPLRPRAKAPKCSELTSAQLMERASQLESDHARAERSAIEARRYIEHAIKTIEASTAGTHGHRADAVEALRDGLALMALGLSHVPFEVPHA
jgi:hypothetical protein